MKRKVDLQELVSELKRENLQKRDFVLPAKSLSMSHGKIIVSNFVSSDELRELIEGTGISTEGKLVLDPLEVFHHHLSGKLDIPKKYYDRMLSGNNGFDKELLAQNVNWWLDRYNNNIFLRTFINREENAGVARAFLSDRFKVIDNFDILLACLEGIKGSGVRLEIEQCDLTDKKMYVRFVAPDIELQSPKLLEKYRSPNPSRGYEGKTGIMTGFVISNSEVGMGQFSISPRCVVGVCSNGIIFKEDQFSKVHLGSKMEEYSKIEWSEETYRKNLELVISQVKDAVKLFISPDYLGSKITQLEDMGAEQLKHPVDTVKNVVKTLSMSQTKERDILDYFVRGGDTSGFGVSQALTFYAHESENADEQYDLEIAAVDVLSNIKSYDKPAKTRKGHEALLN